MRLLTSLSVATFPSALFSSASSGFLLVLSLSLGGFFPPFSCPLLFLPPAPPASFLSFVPGVSAFLVLDADVNLSILRVGDR